MNPTRNHKVAGLIPGLAQRIKDPGVAMSYGVGCRHGLDPELLWLWRRPAAVALIGSLAWEPPCAGGKALKLKKKKKKICFSWSLVIDLNWQVQLGEDPSPCEMSPGGV